MQTTRISWIDIAKGIGIILVIYGHVLISDNTKNIIYAFHMPLFFFLSGLVFHYKSHEVFQTTLLKNIKGIMFPYFKFALLTFLFWAILIVNDPLLKIDKIMDQFWSIFYGNGNGNRLTFNTVLWFLPCLFVTKMVFSLLSKWERKGEFLAIILFMFSIVGYIFSVVNPDLKLPFGIETALTAIVFFGAGYVWNTSSETFKMYFKKYGILNFFVLFLSLTLFSFLNFSEYGTYVDLRINRLDNYFYFYSAAFSGIIATLALSLIWGKNKILEYLGQKTMILFVWHWMVFLTIDKILIHFFGRKIIFDEYIRDIYLAPLYTIISILIILGIDYIVTKKIKHLHISALKFL